MKIVKMKYKPVFGIFLSICVAALFSVGIVLADSNTKIYKQVDSSGRITFTDSPPIDDTQTVEEIKVNIHSSGVTLDAPEKNSTEHIELLKKVQAEVDMEALTKKLKAGAGDVKKKYDLNLTAPKQGQTFLPDTLEIISGIQIEPALERGDKLQVLVNNSPVLPPQTDSVFKLPFLPAGNHELKVQVISAEGNLLAETPPIKFTQLRASSYEPPQ